MSHGIGGNLANRISKAIGFKGLVLSRWIRLGFFALIAYGILQLLVAGFNDTCAQCESKDYVRLENRFKIDA